MDRRSFADLMGSVFGVLAALLLLGLILGAQVRRHEPGLWTLRFQRILDCGVDYNGPPYTMGDINIWVTCGGDDGGWQLWPPAK